MSATNPDRVQAAFLRIVDAPDAMARVAILERECGSDAELRREVVELLGAHDRSGSFLDRPLVKPAAVGDTLPPEPPAATTGKAAQTSNDFGISRGAVIAGRFRLLELIGEGGMGAVWRSEQREPVKRLVALKLIKPGMDSQQVLSRFEAERQALALMDHPSIAKVFDGGMTDQGRPYFVMEYVKGIPITTYCDEARLSLKDRLAIFTQVCEAVQHAHQKGIIHRDLKPSNILVCLYDGKPVPKVIDFGLAKAMHQSLTEHTLYTAHGLMVGTPLYMSPEQAEFNNLDIDTRTDVFSLGVILYELLTGTTPLEKLQFKDAMLQEVLRLIKEEEPQKPSTKLSGSGSLPSIAAQRSLEPAQLSRAVRGDLDWIVMKSLEKERSRRYETASGLARDIDRYLHDEPVEACPPSATYRLKKLIRRNKGPVAAALAVLLVLVIGIIGTTLGLIEARRQEGVAVAAEKLATERLDEVSKAKKVADEQAAIASAVNNFLTNDLLAQANSHAQAASNHEADPNLTVRAALDRAAKKVGTAFANKPIVEAMVRRAIGDAYQGIGEYDKAIEHLERAAKLLREQVGEEHSATRTTLGNLAIAYNHAGRINDAVALGEKVRDLDVKHAGLDEPETLTALGNLAAYYDDAGMPTEAIAILEKAVAVSTKANGADNPKTQILRGNLAAAYISVGRISEAITILEQVRGSLLKTLGANHPDTLTSTVNLAFCYNRDARSAEAITLLEEARRINNKTFGDDHPQSFIILNHLAKAYVLVGRSDEAIELLAGALPREKAKLGENSSTVVSTMGALARANLEAGHIDDSIHLFEQLRDKQGANLGQNDADRFTVLSGLALAYERAGRHTDAIPLMETVRDERIAKLGPNHPDTLESCFYLGEAYFNAGRIDEAIQVYEKARKDFVQARGLEHPLSINALTQLALAYKAAGKNAEAIALCEQLWKLQTNKFGPGSREAQFPLTLLASTYMADGRPEEAIPLMKQARDATIKLLGPAADQSLNSQQSLAAAYTAAGKGAEAIAILEPVIAATTKKYSDDHPETLDVMNRLAAAKMVDGKTAEAFKIWESIVPKSRAKLGATHDCTIELLQQWLKGLELEQQWEKATPVRNELIEAKRKVIGSDQLRFPIALAQYSMPLIQAERWSEAEPIVRETLAIREKSNPDYWSTFNSKAQLGMVLLGEQNYAESEPLLLAGCKGMTQRISTMPPLAKVRVVEAATELVKLYETQQKTEQAKEWQQKLAALKTRIAIPEALVKRPDVAQPIAAERPPSERVISATEMAEFKKLVGADVVVEGTVARAVWSSNGKALPVDFGGDSQDGEFGLHCVIFADDRTRFDSAFGGDVAASFDKARLRVRGTLTLYKDSPQIVLTDPAQVTILK